MCQSSLLTLGSPALSTASVSKVAVFYLATTFLLSSCLALGNASELFEEDPSAILRTHGVDRLRSELAMVPTNDGNVEQLDVRYNSKYKQSDFQFFITEASSRTIRELLRKHIFA